MAAQNEITVQTTVKITTSGYADRYVTGKTTLTLEHRAADGASYTARFDDSFELYSLLRITQNMSDTDALAAIHSAEAAGTVWMSGYIGQGRGMSMKLTDADRVSIGAYLLLRRPDSYTTEAIMHAEAQLAEHPLSENLAAIVAYQLAECDRLNIAASGHADGPYAAAKANR